MKGRFNFFFLNNLIISKPKRIFKHFSTQHSRNENLSELHKILCTKIKTTGPISIASYMENVLTHPSTGYYMNKDVFGTKGDFITSPEISQLFGEMIGIWIINEWKKMYKGPLQIIELGPGRGTLSKDILKVINNFNLNDQVSLHMIEVSPVLSTIQKTNLCLETSDSKVQSNTDKFYKNGITKNNVNVYWYKSVYDIPKGFSVFIANEFFDALPIHKFQKERNEWFEILIDVDPLSDKTFRYVLAKTPKCDELINQDEQRNHLEISPETLNICKFMSSFLTKNGGFSLIIDYGHIGDKTDTFRSFKQHNQCNPLTQPGSADLTADVDFSQIKKIAEDNKLLFFGPQTQRNFLLQLGIDVRLKVLCKNAKLQEQEVLHSSYDKLVGIEHMGSCFKVVSIFPYVLKDFLQKFPVAGFQM